MVEGDANRVRGAEAAKKPFFGIKLVLWGSGEMTLHMLLWVIGRETPAQLNR